MAYYKVGDPEALTQCPYDATHMVRNKRIQYHLIDCRKNHPTSDMKVCPYNAKHVHPNAEHQFHLVHCDDRMLVDRDIIYDCGKERHEIVPERPKGKVSVPLYDTNTSHHISEDWGADACGEPFVYSQISTRLTSGHCDATASKPLRQPKLGPDVLSVTASATELEERRQPRQSNASFSSLSVGHTAATTASSDDRIRAPLAARNTTALGRGQLMAIIAASSNAVMPGGNGRGQPKCSSSSTFSAMSGRPAQSGTVSNGTCPSLRQSNTAASTFTHSASSPSLPGARTRQATVTSAFALPGVGRGRQPPNARDVPLPTFS